MQGAEQTDSPSPVPSSGLADSPYAWLRLALSVVASTIGGVGLWSSVAILPAIEQEFGIDRGGASFPYTATMLGFALGGILMGRLVDRYGISVPVRIGGLMLGIGYVASSYTTELWQFILCQAFLIGMLGSSATFAPMVAEVSLWFVKRRGIAVAIVASGGYLAGAIWPTVLTEGIASLGWRETQFWVGIICFTTLIPISFMLRRRPDIDPGTRPVSRHSSPTGMPAPPKVLIALLGFAGVACCVAMSMPQVHIVAYCGDLGYGFTAGAQMLSLMLVLGIISRLTSGIIADKIGGLGTLMVGSTLQCLALIFYLPFDGLVSLYLVSALFGLSQGGIVPSYALLIRDYFPAREAGAKISFVLMATVIGMALGGWLSGEIYDMTGSYAAAFGNGILWNLANMGIAAWLLLNRNGGTKLKTAAG